MNRNHFWKFVIVVVVIAWSFIEMYPPTSTPLDQEFKEVAVKRDANFNGIVERLEKLQKEKPQAAFNNLLEAIGTNDITRYFPMYSDDFKTASNPARAILNDLQKAAAGKIKLGLDLQGGTSFLVGMDTSHVEGLDTNNAAAQSQALSQAVEVLRKRVDKFGVAEPVIQPQGNDRILIQLPGLSEAVKDEARSTIQKVAYLELRLVHPDSDELVSQGLSEPGYEFMRQPHKARNGSSVDVPGYLVQKKPVLTGKHIKDAHMSRNIANNQPEVEFALDSEGTDIFAAATKENVGRQLAIVLDGELQSAPNIHEPIEGGHGQITGNYTEQEALNLANALQNPLQAPVKILSESSVDPTLGSDTVKSGIRSAIIGTVAVAGFMAVYYLFAGVVANVALISNIIILIGVMCACGTTFTLPGIAGVVLTIGMAVDANVLIFERIREESAKGKSLRGALAAGYDRAFGTIFDSHVTTLISSIILFYMGTGPIKGFGATLSIGVAASLFTALVVTRLIFDFLLAKGWLKSLPMLHIIRASKLDFMKLATPAFILSWTIILVGVGYGFHRGFSQHNLLGTDFAGGDNLILRFSQKVEAQKVREAITKIPEVKDPVIQYQKEAGGTAETLSVRSAFNTADKIVNVLQKDFPDAKFSPAGTERVGPIIGEEIQATAIIASLLSLFGILLYVAFRYEFSFAVGAVLAVIHDVLMTIGCYCLTGLFGEGRQFNATMVAAVLTIIGFSINDTIVIFDRIREDLKLGMRGSFRELINQALNQTLSRTIITSGTVFLATMSLYLFGGGAINDFAFTFLVGIITGTYSSIYIASALVLWWHKGARPKTGSQVVIDVTSAAPARP